jgi:glycerophosphoryl diester phosphodiesterase
MGALDWLDRHIAHRGLHDAERGIVENTPSALSAAIEAGYGIEIDTQPASDGAPVVFHDATLDRLTEGAGPLAAMTPARLRAIRYRRSADPILTLRETLDLVGGRAPLLVEIKSDWSGDGAFGARVARELAAYGGPVAAMSFDPVQVASVRQAAPVLARGLVSERFEDARCRSRLPAMRRFALRHLLHAAETRPHFIAYDINALPALAPRLGRAAFGWALLTWTGRDPAQAQRARACADAMIFEGFRPEPTLWETPNRRP